MHKLYYGDCLDVMKDLKSKSIDLTITSPPYDKARDYNDFCINFDFESIVKELYRLTKKGGVIVWVVVDETIKFCETLTSFKQAIYFVEECGFNLLDTMIYNKTSGPSVFPTLKRYRPLFEYMFIFSKGKPKTFNGIRDIKNKLAGKETTTGKRNKNGSMTEISPVTIQDYSLRSNVWLIDIGYMKSSKDTIAFNHPAIFPEKLAQDHIISWSNENDLVFDPLMGSGTTGKMAIKLNRNFIGIELDEEYFKIAEHRIQAQVNFNNLKEKLNK